MSVRFCLILKELGFRQIEKQSVSKEVDQAARDCAATVRLLTVIGSSLINIP